MIKAGANERFSGKFVSWTTRDANVNSMSTRSLHATVAKFTKKSPNKYSGTLFAPEITRTHLVQIHFHMWKINLFHGNFLFTNWRLWMRSRIWHIRVNQPHLSCSGSPLSFWFTVNGVDTIKVQRAAPLHFCLFIYCRALLVHTRRRLMTNEYSPPSHAHTHTLTHTHAHYSVWPSSCVVFVVLYFAIHFGCERMTFYHSAQVQDTTISIHNFLLVPFNRFVCAKAKSRTRINGKL